MNVAEADGSTALHWAVQRNEVDVVSPVAGRRAGEREELVRLDADVRGRGHGNAVLIDRLVAAGADVECPTRTDRRR